MSKGLTLLALMLSAIMGYSQAVSLPITYEDPAQAYTFNDFDGGMVTVLANPQSNGINTSATVAQMVKGPGQPWGGSLITLGAPIDFSTNKQFKLKVYSPRIGARLLLKVENITNGGVFFEKEDTTTVANAWEELTFDYSLVDVNQQYSKIVFIFDLGVVGDGTANFTFLFDEIELVQGVTAALSQIDLPVTFEDTTVDYTVTDFGGNATTVVADPTDPTNTVGRSVKTPSAQLWAGTSVGTSLGFATAIPFTATETKMSVRVWSPVAGVPIRLKTEDHTNAGISVETETLTTMAGAWETLEFDFTNPVPNTAALDINNTYDLASLFFNFGADGAAVGADSVYYWDDVMFVAGATLAQIDLPVTFEDATVDYTVTDFGGNATTVVADPTDPTNTVGRSVKTPSAQLWAGTSVGTSLGFATAIPFTATETKMSVRVWSPVAGVPIRLKTEDHTNAGISVETETMTTMAGAWETLEFDFTNPVPNTAALDINNTYDLASLFFNFGADGAAVGADSVYYWDDVMFGGMPGPVLNQIDLPVTMEDTLVNYTMTDFGGNATTVVTDPTDPTNTVGRTAKTATAETWAGTTMGTSAGFATAIPFTATETKMNLRIWSPVAGVPIRLKVEDHTDDGISVETEATTTMAGAWETLEFDFSNEAMGTAALDINNTYDMASIFFNFGADGAAVGADSVYFWDDVMFGPSTVGLDDLRALDLRYYPNPVTNQLFVSAAGRIDQLIVLNQMGQEVMTVESGSNEQVLDLSSLSSGVYFVKVSIGEAWGTFKVLKD